MRRSIYSPFGIRVLGFVIIAQGIATMIYGHRAPRWHMAFVPVGRKASRSSSAAGCSMSPEDERDRLLQTIQPGRVRRRQRRAVRYCVGSQALLEGAPSDFAHPSHPRRFHCGSRRHSSGARMSCPTPTKRKYGTLQAAVFFARANVARAYKCTCGAYHLSTKPRTGKKIGLG